MDDYISRQAVFNAFSELDYDISSNQTFDNLYGNYGFSEETVNQTISNIPAADVRLVVRGYWDSNERCSVCGEKSTEGLDAEKWDYWCPDFCPHCGAIMMEE